MKSPLTIFLFLLFFTFQSVHSQNHFGIVFPKTDAERNQQCQNCFQVFKQKPKEVKFSISRERNNLYFEVNDKSWFNKLFKNNGDGIAIDVVAKDRYDCELETIDNSQIRGKLLKPIYAQGLKKGLRKTGENSYRVHVGRITDTYLNKELEYNILFLNNKTLCRYYVIYDLESYPWDLLDMGMYLDTLTYSTKQIKPDRKEGFVLKHKALKFIIPFEKNISEYSPEDIKPMYDSLRLTDFNIKKITIRAYSSIEGSLQRNIELQEQRANSIAKALQTFQKPTIITEIFSSENWVEFLKDISETKYENLKNLSKADLKSKLVGSFSKEMEPFLKNHRKAVITLELEKKDKYKSKSADDLLMLFNTAIKQEKLSEAIILQNSIFERMNAQEISPDFLRKMTIPNQSKFVKIFNKNSAYKFMRDVRQSMIVYEELQELLKLDPTNGEVKYNIIAVKFKLWRYKFIEVDENKFNNEINALSNYSIDQKLIARMMVNFHIVKAENLMRKRDYKNKDRSVVYINNNYKNFPLSDYDYLSLSQFFSFYANIKMSIKLLENKVSMIDTDEDLLFYYLNLTLIDKELTQKSNYRTIMLNAINMNKERFCKLYNSVENGGVTFQLLEDEYLRGVYCENCDK